MHKLLMPIYRKMFARPCFINLNKTLFHFSIRGLGVLNYEDSRLSGEDYFISTVLPGLIKSAQPVFFDVGANVGDYSRSLLAAFPEAKVFAFEPHPENFKKLSQINQAGFQAFNMALSNKAGEFELYDRADYQGSSHASLYRDVITDIHRQDVDCIRVQMDTLENHIHQLGLSYIDFLKVDTEGSELQVLEGAREFIMSGNIGCIHFEFNEMNVVSHVFMRDFKKLLEGYDLFRLLPKGMIPVNSKTPLLNEIFAYQNIVALSGKGN